MSVWSRLFARIAPAVTWAERTGIDVASPTDVDIDEIAEYGFGWLTVGLPIGASGWSLDLNRVVDRAHGHGLKVAFMARPSSYAHPMIQPYAGGCRAALDAGVDLLVVGDGTLPMPLAFVDAGRAPRDHHYPKIPLVVVPSESWPVAEVTGPTENDRAARFVSRFDLWERRIAAGTRYDGHMIRTWRDTPDRESGLVTEDGAPKRPSYDRVRYRLRMPYPPQVEGV